VAEVADVTQTISILPIVSIFRKEKSNRRLRGYKVNFFSYTCSHFHSIDSNQI
jgi:hypothetical protein